MQAKNNPRHQIATPEIHREWCKKRALSYLSRGEIGNALANLNADLMRHEVTKHLNTMTVPVTREGALSFLKLI